MFLSSNHIFRPRCLTATKPVARTPLTSHLCWVLSPGHSSSVSRLPALDMRASCSFLRKGSQKVSSVRFTGLEMCSSLILNWWAGRECWRGGAFPLEF